MSTSDKAGRLLIVGLPGPRLNDKSKALLARIHPGGVCLYKKNIESDSQVRDLVADVKSLYSPEMEPFIAVDEEGGAVSRFEAGILQLPGAMALGAAGSPDLAREAGEQLGRYLRSLGINMNFAPVLEPATNPASRTIGVRAFSDESAAVSTLGGAFVAGQQSAGLLSVVKHFPGHGIDQVDSHWRIPVIPAKTLEELDEETRPFAVALTDGGADGVMVSHAAIPGITGTLDPITFSHDVLTDYVKGRLGFRGIVVTDALSMSSLRKAERAEDVAARRAVEAGADMVLLPSGDPSAAHAALADALTSGAISEERSSDALMRICALRKPHRDRAQGATEGPDAALPREIARRSITVLKGGDVVPVRPGSSVAVVTTSSAFHVAANRLHPARSILLPFLAPDLYGVPREWAPDVLDGARAACAKADVLVVAIINDEELPLPQSLRALGKPVVLVSLGRPYLLELGRDADALVAAYSYTPASAEAVVSVLSGSEPPAGRLPVMLPHFERGAGLMVLGGPKE